MAARGVYQKIKHPILKAYILPSYSCRFHVNQVSLHGENGLGLLEA